MSSPYIGEIRMFGGNFAPVGWAFCNGAVMAIAENDVLFELIGTTYGGDGQETFNLPDLQGRIPIHQGSGFVIGQVAGTETVTLVSTQIPAHNHGLGATTAAGDSQAPTNAIFASSALAQFTAQAASAGTFNTAMVQTTGGGQPHENLVPFLAVTFIISLFGIFPSQN